MKLKTPLIAAAHCLGIVALAPVQAQVLYQTDFTGADGTDPAGWSYVTDPYEMNIQGNAFVVVRPNGANPAGLRSTAVFEGTDLNGDNPDTWTDYVVTTRLQGSNFNVTASGLLQGVVARYVDVSNPGYTASVRAGNIDIFLNPTALETNQGSLLATSALSESLANNTWYWLSFSVEGNSLSASVYLDNGGSMGSLIGSVSVEDATFGAGTAGVRVGLTSTTTRSVTYDSLTVAAIPEPTTSALIISSVSAMVFCLTRRTRRTLD